MVRGIENKCRIFIKQYFTEIQIEGLNFEFELGLMTSQLRFTQTLFELTFGLNPKRLKL